MVYNFYQVVSESASLVYSGSFADDLVAISYLSNLPVGVYYIERITIIDPSTSYNAIIYGPQ